jgi:hypothetical protein
MGWRKLKVGLCLVGAEMGVLVGVFLNSPGWSQEVARLTPRQVVETWLQVYPGNMNQAAELTTMSFREGASKEDWVATHGQFLKNLGMKYVRAKVVHEESVGKEMHVIVHAHIVTLMGDHPQDERYILVPNAEAGWLIDQVEVYTESFNRVP